MGPATSGARPWVPFVAADPIDAVGVAGLRLLEAVLAEGEEVDCEVKAVGDQFDHRFSLFLSFTLPPNLGIASDVQVFVHGKLQPVPPAKGPRGPAPRRDGPEPGHRPPHRHRPASALIHTSQVMGSGRNRAAERLDAAASFSLFAFLVASALILHQLWWDGFDARHGVVIVAAGWVLLRPSSVGRLLLLITAEVVTVGADMPNVGDHILLVAIVGTGVLAQGVWMGVQRRGLPGAGELFERVAPLLRAAAVILYAAAALSKMNSAFFDPEISAAGEMLSRIAWIDPAALVGEWRVEAAIVSTVAVEVLLAVLLAIPRTRVAGLVVGGGFHVVLALAGNVPFAAVMLALYVGFLPAEAPRRARAAIGARFERGAWGRLGSKPAWVDALVLALLVGAWQLAGALEDADPAAVETLLDNGTRIVIIALVAVAAALWVRVRASAPPGQRNWSAAPGTVRRLSPILAIGVVILVANSLSPYLGLKSQTSFNMFSDLRTEAGRWNHVLVPESVRIFGYQDDLVQISGSNDSVLSRYGESGELVVRYELDRYLRRHSGAYATTASVDGSVPRLLTGEEGKSAPLQPLVDGVARFKPVPPPPDAVR